MAFIDDDEEEDYVPQSATNYYFEDDDKEPVSFVSCQGLEVRPFQLQSGDLCSHEGSTLSFVRTEISRLKLERSNLQALTSLCRGKRPSSEVPLKYKPAALPSTFSLSLH
ncbi:hypothetical protein IGI04_018446 [Brassica rapa subsp. trilocularis]|uniref:Uncharacterized protein n=1 Tax=Brassica rapa subsp. trilocularis TaxID=1813537 RepID=A0ABQ7MCZ8_BRACM|nr:hypothetical protein IGI04_018446 [Brassica rapa subsp. trilocularis]